MSVREQLAQALTDGLPGWRVLPYAAEPDALTRPTVIAWASKLERRPEFGLYRFLVTLEVWVVAPSENLATVDDILDEAFEDVLAVLQPLEWLQWDSAERGVLYDQFHGWKITALAVATITGDES